MNFIALDFETANPHRASACSVAIIVVRDNQIMDEFYSLINPETTFHKMNMSIHGIHKKDVANAPTFPAIWPLIRQFFTSNQLVIAHNNSFDNSVLARSLERYQLTIPQYKTLDTVKTTKQFFPKLKNYRLNTVSKELGIELHHHHNALDDSLACAKILIHEQKQFGNNAIQPFIKVKN
jgi:DNA polymerase III subunit epsilon